MLLFCPACSNALTVSLAPSHSIPADYDPSSNPSIPIGSQPNRLECRTCPYQFILSQQRWYERKNFTRREREDVIGGPGAWDNAQRTKMQCPKDGCDGQEAAFFMVQIRSADEPMTGFYKCMTCDHRWREN